MNVLEKQIQELASSLASSIISTLVSTPIGEITFASSPPIVNVTEPAKENRTHARTHARARDVPRPWRKRPPSPGDHGKAPRKQRRSHGANLAGDRALSRASSPAARFVSERRSSVRRLGDACARAEKIRRASRARDGEARCVQMTTSFGPSMRCVRAARWLVVGKEYCTIHATRARRDRRVGSIPPMMIALRAPGPACCLCKGRGVLRVGKASIIPAWCPCTPIGRELANGRPDVEVLAELAGDELDEAAA